MQTLFSTLKTLAIWSLIFHFSLSTTLAKSCSHMAAWYHDSERAHSWLSLKLTLKDAPYNTASTARQCRRSTSCLQFNLTAGCRRQITTVQSTWGDKSATKCGGAPVTPAILVMWHQSILFSVLLKKKNLAHERERERKWKGKRCSQHTYAIILLFHMWLLISNTCNSLNSYCVITVEKQVALKFVFVFGSMKLKHSETETTLQTMPKTV